MVYVYCVCVLRLFFFAWFGLGAVGSERDEERTW